VSRYVIDNAVTMAWCFTEEATSYTENLLDRLSNLVDTAVVPALWLYEVTNVSMLAVRKGRVSKAKATKFLHDLADLPIEVEAPANPASTFATISQLMEQYRLTAYDAVYLELVIRRQLPLATFDKDLIAACKAVGSELI
jgi:predicted nucleic acid-binding protein